MSDTELNREELADIQGLVTSGYGNLKCSRFLFLQVQQTERVRAWLAQLWPQITTSSYRPRGTPRPDSALNIALTCKGLHALGLPQEAVEMFPREFQEGMASGERPRVLGDTEDSDPAKWDIGAPQKGDIHLLLLLYAHNNEALNHLYRRLEPDFETGGLKILYMQDTGRISDTEPFGFRDGISQPVIAGSPGKSEPAEIPINAGEFVLGYRNGYDTIPPSPTLPATLDADNILPTLPDAGQIRKDFGRNGTYLIFRKLAQDVTGFWKYVEAQAALLGMPPDKTSAMRVAAKIVGRWPSGAPLVLTPERDDPSLGKTNDPDGYACPVGAHIRRANPRDSLESNPERSRLLSNRHRLVRRGRHYEDHRSPGETWEPSGVEHGLCFIALNADIQRQFEFVQQTWLLSPKFGGLYDEKDALIGDNDGSGHLSLPAHPVRQRLCSVPRFVRVRGGGYFFLPGIRALRFLAKT
jgi:Dyp-type peroxidase family